MRFSRQRSRSLMRSRLSMISLSGLALAAAISVAALFVGPVFAPKSLAANVIRHSDWRSRSFAAHSPPANVMGIRSFAAHSLAANVMGIRSFAALTKSQNNSGAKQSAGQTDKKSDSQSAGKSSPAQTPAASGSIEKRVEDFLRKWYAWDPDFQLKVGPIKPSPAGDLYEV